jgi:hypothetical protein
MRYTAAKSRPTAAFDADLEFKDSGAVGASAAATVDSVAKVVDMGTGFFKGKLWIDVTAIEVDTGNESYKIAVELSDNSGFSAGSEYERCAIVLGDSSIHGGDTDTAVGRYSLDFDNRIPNGSLWRYARVYTTVAGTIGGTGITFSAFADRN